MDELQKEFNAAYAHFFKTCARAARHKNEYGRGVFEVQQAIKRSEAARLACIAEREAEYKERREADLSRLQKAGILSPAAVRFARNVHEGAKRPGRGLKGLMQDTGVKP